VVQNNKKKSKKNNVLQYDTVSRHLLEIEKKFFLEQGYKKNLEKTPKIINVKTHFLEHRDKKNCAGQITNVCFILLHITWPCETA
jgi:hypothetical protein